ncbi:MAG: hypothetical protein GOU99_03730 [Candidatus Altiarchaeota archaeon]|nr:hypothetical protein [Candidatus Altiarchaeota archaeon]
MEINAPADLSLGIKNYWFFYGNDGPAQFIFTFGTSRLPFRVNGKSARFPNYAVLLWAYHPDYGKQVFVDTSIKMECKHENPIELEMLDGKYSFEYKGIKIKSGKEYLSPLVETKFVRNKFVNEYRIFKGKIFDKRIKGKGYFQRVNAGTPFAPWDWLRFSNGCVGDLFTVKGMKSDIEIDGIKYPVKLSTDKGALELKSDKVDLRTSPYERYDLNFLGLGKFRYSQFLVKVDGLVDEKKIDAYGIVEEARGIVF